MTHGETLWAVLALVVFGSLIAVSIWAFRQRSRLDRAAVRRAAPLAEPDIASPPRDPQPPGRPWWGNPWVWVAIIGAFLVLGFLVWPGLFGGIFLFVPFVWLSRPRPSTMDPRSNGHAKRDGPVA